MENEEEDTCENCGSSGFLLLDCEECGDPVCSHCNDTHLQSGECEVGDSDAEKE